MNSLTKQEKRSKLLSLLGDLPAMNRAVRCEKIAEITFDNYILENLLLDLNGIELVPAYFVKPIIQKEKFPAILYNHAHGGDYELGKNELIRGRKSLQEPPYADVLAGMGIASLCIDAWAFGDRRGRSESELFKEMLWNGRVLWGMMVYDSLKALDYLSSRPDVDADKIGTLGFSMGSTMAWWIAALDERIQVCVDICCLSDFRSLIAQRALDGHNLYYYVPGLLKHFDTADILALISPRYHLSLNGKYDKLTPIEGLYKIDAVMKRVYKEDGNPDGWKLLIYDTGHYETAYMRKEVVDFLNKYLIRK
ncbi:MAG: alpha/beta hydrolase [Firmicutes bacterium]|nr:alpha/beta hydrolase [Bacillota bacterium]